VADALAPAVAVGTTVQEKAIAHPTDARLTYRVIEKLVDLANGTLTGVATTS
jgi:hypothetical protein